MDAQELLEAQEGEQRDRKADRRVAQPSGRTEAARHEDEENGRGDDEAERLYQRDVQDQPAGHPAERGQVAAGVSGLGEFAENIKAGRMKALGVSSDRRIPGVDIPTFKEQGIDVSIANWRGVFAPPGVTDAQRKAMIDLIEATVKSAAWQEILTKQDWANVLLTGDAFGAYVQEEFRRTEAVLKDLGLA